MISLFTPGLFVALIIICLVCMYIRRWRAALFCVVIGIIINRCFHIIPYNIQTPSIKTENIIKVMAFNIHGLTEENISEKVEGITQTIL